MAHMGHRFGHDREIRREQSVFRRFRMPNQGTDANPSVRSLDPAQPFDPVDVDQTLRLHQPEVHHRDQTLTAS